jgi:manganese oxidase
LAYEKNSEGAFYADGLKRVASEGDFVAPGRIYTYTWTVPERAGPAHGDGSSVIWMYHSHFVEDRDMNTGLLGPIIITGKDLSKPDYTPRDIDREFVTAFAVFDESQSWFFEANRAKQTRTPTPVRAGVNPYLIYSINGYIEGNMPMLNMRKGERVRWYFITNGNADDVHTPHWHSETVIANHMRTDTIQLTPMGMSVADMLPDTPGTWLFHCHVADHFEGGMQALFTVLP